MRDSDGRFGIGVVLLAAICCAGPVFVVAYGATIAAAVSVGLHHFWLFALGIAVAAAVIVALVIARLGRRGAALQRCKGDDHPMRSEAVPPDRAR